MQNFSFRSSACAASLSEPYILIWSHKVLLLHVAITSLRQRHAGTALGSFWLILAPLLLLTTYSFMFIIVLGIRPPGLTLAQYVAHMTCGLLLFLTTSQALMSATSALSQEPGLLFNVVFPAELFPVREVLIACPALFAALSVPASVWGFSSGTVGWSWLLLPPLTVLFLMALIGSAWILALANLVVRDTSQILAFGLTLLMLTSPIAFVKEMLPQQARLLVQLNPFASYVLSFQEIIVHGRAPGAALSISVVTISVIIFHLGYALFKRGKSVIAENI